MVSQLWTNVRPIVIFSGMYIFSMQMLAQRRYAIWETTYLFRRMFLIQIWMKLTSWHVFGEDDFWIVHVPMSLNYLFYFLLFGVDLTNDLCCVQLIERPRVLAYWTNFCCSCGRALASVPSADRAEKLTDLTKTSHAQLFVIYMYVFFNLYIYHLVHTNVEL